MDRTRERTARPRPASITLAAVLLLGAASFGVLTLVFAFAAVPVAPDAGLPPLVPRKLWPVAAWALVRGFAGVGVLRRWGWTRWTYAAWAVPVSGLAFAGDPMAPRWIVGFAFTWLTIALLLTPAATAWFVAYDRDVEVGDVFR